MNRPRDYRNALIKMVEDGRITPKSLEERLEKSFKFVEELEALALKQHCEVIPGLVGTCLCPEMCIVSPTRYFYFQCLCESDKTPTMETVQEATPKTAFSSGDGLLKATWGKDDIQEDVSTSADNESSIVLQVKPEGDAPFLLVGDAGCRGLSQAIQYSASQGMPLSECKFLQIPHHGGRHNVSPKVLDRLVGPIVSPNAVPTKVAFVSVGKKSDHPRKCVVNAFVSRGCKVFVSKGTTICHHEGGSSRVGWVPATQEAFSDRVEAW